MRRGDQVLLGQAFHNLHQTPFLLPNAWDAISSLILAGEEFPAVATTSGGVSWALGYADGEQAPWPEVIKAIERITRVLRVPLSAASRAAATRAQASSMSRSACPWRSSILKPTAPASIT